MNSLPTPFPPGACYKFKVKSAEEAATLIRERLGPTARVLSVRSVESGGLRRLWSAPELEVIAQLDGPAEAPKETSAETDDEDDSDLPQQRASEPETAAAKLTSVPEADSFKPRSSPPASFRKSRAAPTLPDLLRRSGLSEMALGRLQEMPSWDQLLAAPLHRALVEVGRTFKKNPDSAGRGLP